MKNKRKFGSDREAARKFAEQVNGRVFCGKLGDLIAYMVVWNTKTEQEEETKPEIKAGDSIETSKFLRLYINEIFENEKEMRKAGYTEMIYYINDKWKAGGKQLDEYNMEFAACRK